MARANLGRSVGLLGHTQRKVLNLSLADQQRQRHPKEGGHDRCSIRSIDWRKKGSLRASRYYRAVLDQVLLCVVTGTDTKQIGNALFLLVYQAVGRKANSQAPRFVSVLVISFLALRVDSVAYFICQFPW